MSEVWQTIEQAAVTLGLSVRTVNRHITAGKLQSRLFEGRREVLVALPDERPRAESFAAAGASAAAGRDGQESRPGAANGQGTDDLSFSSSAVSPSASAGASDPFAEPAQRDAFRQTVTADFGADRPLDGQTMLALADSIDDKATLAVGAYQTLARSAETQVQSLRRVAFGAWAVVGVMAAGVIVAVGWATHRLTTAEVTATHLSKEVDKQTTDKERLAAERERDRAELQNVRQQADSLRARLVEVADRVAEQRLNAAEMVQFAVRELDKNRPANPTAVHAPGTHAPGTHAPATAPATAPSAAGAAAVPASPSAAGPGASVAPNLMSNQVGASAAVGGFSSASRPTAPTATRPAGQRMTLPPNTEEAFGTR